MAFLPETVQRVLTRTTTPENDCILPQKIKELSIARWGKEIILLGHHPAYLEALQKSEQFAPSDEPVLITGESGVGKELFARALYLLGRRNNAPYVCVNCGWRIVTARPEDALAGDRSKGNYAFGLDKDEASRYTRYLSNTSQFGKHGRIESISRRLVLSAQLPASSHSGFARARG
jgi:hypothetical protein